MTEHILRIFPLAVFSRVMFTWAFTFAGSSASQAGGGTARVNPLDEDDDEVMHDLSNRTTTANFEYSVSGQHAEDIITLCEGYRAIHSWAAKKGVLTGSTLSILGGM